MYSKNPRIFRSYTCFKLPEQFGAMFILGAHCSQNECDILVLMFGKSLNGLTARRTMNSKRLSKYQNIYNKNPIIFRSYTCIELPEQLGAMFILGAHCRREI